MTGRPMRVLIATPEYPPHAGGGITKIYGTLAPALARAGADVTVVVSAPFADDFPSGVVEGVRVHHVPRAAIDPCVAGLSAFAAAPLYRRWLGAAWAARDAAAVLGPFDVVEATDFGLTCVPFAIDPIGAPVLVQLQGSLGQIADREPYSPADSLDDLLSRLTELAVLPYADALESLGGPNAVEWRARLGRDVSVQAPPTAEEPRVGAPGHGVLTVGRIQSWKGPEVLCRALRQVPAEIVPAVRWIGRDMPTAPEGGSFDRHLRAQFPDVWGTRVQVSSQVSNGDALRAIAAARVVVVPSTWDVFNLTAIEAMAMGRIVICSDGAGAADLIEHGRNGFVVASGQADALATVLVEALQLSAGAAEAMRGRACETARTRIAPDVVAAARLRRFEDVVAAPRRQPCPDWLASAFRPHDDGAERAAYLDHLSIRDLSAYLGRRVTRRLLGAAAGGSEQS